MKASALLLLFVVLSSQWRADGLKFLVYNPRMNCKSHTTFMGKLADTLAAAGHLVVSYQPIYTNDFNATGVRLARTVEWRPSFAPPFTAAFMQETMWSGMSWSGALSMAKSFASLWPNLVKCCEEQLSDETMMQQLEDEHFDLALMEIVEPCIFGILERIRVKKFILVSSFPLPIAVSEWFGLPAASSFVPASIAPYVEQMSFAERTANWLMGKGMGLLLGSFASFVQPVIRAKVNSSFDFHERLAEASYVFVNQDEFLDHPRPLSAKIVHIGGVGISREHVKPLPLELEKRMSEAERGVVYVSFGTMAPASAMRDETKREFLELFARFSDVLFLMKYEKKDDQFGEGVPNLLTDEYFPQQDVLAHSRTLAFISHGGMSSVNEAAVFGVPLLVNPLQGDQMRNARLVERKGLGVQLGKAEMTVDRLAAELRRLLETPDFRRNAQRMAAILAAKPMSADQKVVKFAEFAAKFDVHEHLDFYGRHLNTIQYHSLDVFAFFLLVSVFLSYSTYRLLKFAIVRCCLNRPKHAKVE